ncbi:uncharacterized protein LOC143188853 [Calliopsis andreniformis]|uniref:uncharacterized protein LOC143188853 n=1 Tax=Calliopsis andreniformis TaxID=337506 RepID=UPI003FCE77F7
MCDLIDFNSPDTKGFLSSRLASPLIPVPTDSTCGNSYNRLNKPSSQTLQPRDSLENNPFDMVLHKTTEYIQKKDDPFEVMLEKALKPKSKKRTCSVDFTDDCGLKQKKLTQRSKMNKTLDDSLIKNELNVKNIIINKMPYENRIFDLDNIHELKNNVKSDTVAHNANVPAINIEDINSSILSHSLMNNTLFEEDEEVNKDLMKINLEDEISTCVEGDTLNVNEIPLSNAYLKLPKLRRSFSQGEKISPKKSKHLNLTSLVESLRTRSGSSNNVSTSSYDCLNTAFRRSHSSGSSVFSSISNISSIPKLNSVSSATSSSMIMSNNTLNRTFIESLSSENISATKLSEQIDSIKEANISLNKSQFSISDLAERFNKLKTKASEVQINEKSENEKNEVVSNFSTECITVMEKDKECITNNKLIDVDIFKPETNYSKESSTSFNSDTSSDSVFLEGNKINKSILQEARHLARTFEELALKTSSGSSIDDLISNNSLWTSELLPAFDDEIKTDNLIELLTSPNTNDVNSKNEKVMEQTKSDSSTEKHEICDTKKTEGKKVIEMELIEPEKRISAATLLLDLKKLVGTENNMEANKLLNDLEKALGVNWENNTELLTTCLSLTNNLGKSPQKSKCNLEIIKNVAENNMEYSQEDNLANNSSENIIKMDNNLKTNTCINNTEKCLKEINSPPENEILKAKSNVEEMNNEKEENKFDTEEECKKDSFHETKNNNFGNEKMVLELLANIGKLLTNETEKHSSLDVLKNLGKALHFATNNYNVNENIKPDCNYEEIQQTPKKSVTKFENKKCSSVLSKSRNRFSLDLDSKKQSVNKNSIRRSISVSQTPPPKSIPSPVMSKGKSTSQLKEVTKRFPSDPGLASPPSDKKIITKSDKNNLGKDTQIKSATLNIHKEKTSIVDVVKTKLKKKNGTDIVNKRGPLKALIPIGNMQKRDTINKKAISPAQSVTPPKSHKIISSTPNTLDDKPKVSKTSRSAKPVASSTPDIQTSKTRDTQAQTTNYLKKRNFSCDISPVTTRVNVNNKNGINNSPKRISKLPSPKRTTPKRRPTESGIPKSQTPPVNKRLNSSFDINQYEHFPKNNDKLQASPLRESNKIMYKVKPINLISKMRRHSTGTNVMEKENI